MSSKRRTSAVRVGCALLTAIAMLPAAARAQSAVLTPAPIAVGAIAPDFALPGATRFGTLDSPVRLNDFRGQTVVIAFFYRARSKG